MKTHWVTIERQNMECDNIGLLEFRCPWYSHNLSGLQKNNFCILFVRYVFSTCKSASASQHKYWLVWLLINKDTLYSGYLDNDDTELQSNIRESLSAPGRRK